MLSVFYVAISISSTIYRAHRTLRTGTLLPENTILGKCYDSWFSFKYTSCHGTSNIVNLYCLRGFLVIMDNLTFEKLGSNIKTNLKCY